MLEISIENNELRFENEKLKANQSNQQGENELSNSFIEETLDLIDRQETMMKNLKQRLENKRTRGKGKEVKIDESKNTEHLVIDQSYRK